MFKAQVTAATGIATSAINIVSWSCGSVTVTMTILGSSTALIAAARASLIAAAGTILPCTYGPVQGTQNRPGYYPVPYCRYYPCVPTIPFNPSYAHPLSPYFPLSLALTRIEVSGMSSAQPHCTPTGAATPACRPCSRCW